MQTKQEPKSLPESASMFLEDYQPKPHKHKELIKTWLEDTNQRVWYWSDSYKEWGVVRGTPRWDDNTIFAIGEKPIEPPEKKLKFPWGTIEFYAPDSKASTSNYGYNAIGDNYFVRYETVYYFPDMYRMNLFRDAMQKYENNLDKFFKGELNAMYQG